jgi:hypothetical protein
MAKQYKANKWGVFALEFIGAVIFLWLVFAVLNGNAYENTAWSGAGLWLPLIYPAALISAMALFFVSFSNVWRFGEVATKSGVPVSMVISVIAGFTTLVLTVGSLVYMITALAAFVIAFVGTLFQHAE